MCSTRPTEVSDDDRCEYATLTCRGPAGSVETKAHLKLTFHDDRTAADDGQATVLWVRAMVVGADASGVYEGRVSGHQAAAVKSVTTTDDSHATAVRRWLRSAQHALVGRRDDDDDDSIFLHCLERASCDDDDDGRPALVLTWKKKLRPFGAFTLGSVRLCGIVDGTVADSMCCGLFVEPLIRRLSAERRRGELAERAAADDARLLMADNRRLLDELRSAADGRRLDDCRLMARFVEVLNAKKKKLDAVRQELSDLKEQLQQRGDNVPSSETIDAIEQDVVVKRRGSRGRTRKSAAAVKTNAREQSWLDRGRMDAAKRGRRQMSTVDRWLSEEDDVDADVQQLKRQDNVMETDDRVTISVVEAKVVDANDQQQKRQESVMETDDRVTNSIVAVEVVDVCDQQQKQQESVMETDNCVTNSTVKEEAVVNFNIFEADTLIDDSPPSSPPWFQQCSTTPQADTNASPASSPPWLQQLTPRPFKVTDEEPSPLPQQPSPIKDVGHRKPQKKSFLDDLWSGIV